MGCEAGEHGMMRLLLAGVAAALLWVPGMVLAEEKALANEEIKSLLSGATIKGIHFGVETRQYFSESGLTLWIKEGDDKPSEARYKIEADQYCSSWTGLWNEEEWGCFDILHDEEQNIYYFTADNFRAPFVINSQFDLDFQ